MIYRHGTVLFSIFFLSEIPLFHVLNARITFGNIFATDADVSHVHRIQEDDRLTCILDDSIFQCPSNYNQIGNGNASTIFIIYFFFFCFLFFIKFLCISSSI